MLVDRCKVNWKPKSNEERANVRYLTKNVENVNDMRPICPFTVLRIFFTSQTACSNLLNLLFGVDETPGHKLRLATFLFVCLFVSFPSLGG